MPQLTARISNLEGTNMEATSKDVRAPRRRGNDNQPEWATMVMEQFAAYHRRSDLPQIAWRYSKKSHHSSGVTHWEYFPGTTQINRSDCRVVVTQGKCRMDALLVLMHELSHWIDGYDNADHGTQFWHIAWRSYKHFGLPLSYVFAREATYRKEAIHVGVQYVNVSTDYYRRALSGDIARAPIYRTPENAPPSVLGWEAIIGFVQPETPSKPYVSRNAPLPPINTLKVTYMGTNVSPRNNPSKYTEHDYALGTTRYTTDGGKTWHPGFAPKEED